jgi:YVTN family beta-propeller protein
MSYGRTSLTFGRLTAILVLVFGPMLSLAPSASAAGSSPPAGAVYVTNLNLNTVTAINATTHQITVIQGTTQRFNGPLGIAIAPNGRTAYVTNSLGSTVTPVDLTTTPATLGPGIKVGSGPSAIAITADGKTAYVSNFNANTVTPIDLTTSPATPGTPIHVGFGPWSIAVSPNGATVCVSNSEASSVSVIDAASGKVTTVEVGNRPQAIAIAPDGSTAYVANGNQVTPIHLRSTSPSAGAPIAIANGPVGIAITPDGKMAYTANNDHTVTPINLAVTPARPRASITVGSLTQPDGIAISPNGATAYAANASNNVTPIDLAAKPARPLASIDVGTATFGIAIAPGQAPIARLHVTPGRAGRVTHFDASASRSPGSKIVKFQWTFGDGTSAATTTSRTTHVYQRSGRFTASVAVTNAEGTSATMSYTGQTVSNNGRPTAIASRVFVVAGALQTNPPAGPPGKSIGLRDTAFHATCNPVYVFFDNKLVGSAIPSGHVLNVSNIVVPGNAALGHHQLRLSCATKPPYLLSADFKVVNTKNHLSEFSVAMPNLKELRGHLADAGGISIGMLLLSRIIAAGFPSEWIDRTYEANRHRFSDPIRKKFPRLFVDRNAPRSKRRRYFGGTIMFVAFIAIAGLINSILDPAFGWNRTTMWLLLGMSLGVAILTFASQLPFLVTGLRRHRTVHLQVLLGGMVIAILCVGVSRAIGLSPGYCYGLLAVFLIRPNVEEKDRGRLHAMSSLSILVAATLAFLITDTVFKAATGDNPSVWLLILNPALNIVFLAGFANLAFGMFPLPFLAGQHVVKWNRAVGLLIGGLGLCGFVAVLLTPGSGSTQELQHVGMIPIVGAFVGFAVASLGAMVYFRRHPYTGHVEEEGEEATPELGPEPA